MEYEHNDHDGYQSVVWVYQTGQVELGAGAYRRSRRQVRRIPKPLATLHPALAVRTCRSTSELGDRKICFFLVDPHRRVHSTSDVPPQRRSWYEKEMPWWVPALRELPTELYAKPVVRRLERRRGRTSLCNRTKTCVYGVTFSLCEH